MMRVVLVLMCFLCGSVAGVQAGPGEQVVANTQKPLASFSYSSDHYRDPFVPKAVTRTPEVICRAGNGRKPSNRDCRWDHFIRSRSLGRAGIRERGATHRHAGTNHFRVFPNRETHHGARGDSCGDRGDRGSSGENVLAGPRTGHRRTAFRRQFLNTQMDKVQHVALFECR